MHRFAKGALALALTLSSTAALAQAYGGIAIGNRGSQHWQDPVTGVSVGPSDRKSPLIVHAGWKISDDWAIEGGHARLMDADFAHAGRASSGESAATYVAARWRRPLTQSVAWYAKAGVARNTLEVTETGSATDKAHKVRPMVALGVEYAFTPHVAATAEVASYGKVSTRRSHISHNLLQLGLRFDY
ncbi:outer membrane beta-barrel protein [Pseudoduganella chitinolytica]|uniref:Outer membrane beta-barrel protein n=1 Tax=Pseudoduganella chitinolytica TaxID=34070 RepID=A0ABY8BEN9_9BURK|nr:outer membrane beta-barrel protein [Pseudoduganella chitinolytica]WEF33863.1 outer membrane beta-barrel protein [Pseudoduganella chitinolytica]